MTSAILLTLEASLIPQMPLELGKRNCNLCLSKLECLNINATTLMAQGYIHHVLALHNSITFTPPPLPADTSATPKPALRRLPLARQTSGRDSGGLIQLC